MIAVSFLVAGLPSQRTVPLEWSQRNDIPNYKAAFIPTALKDQKPHAVALGVGGVRGYRTVVSHWVVKEPFVKTSQRVLRELSQDAGVATIGENDLKQRGSAYGQKTMGDRVVQVLIQKGKPVVKKTKSSTSYEFADEEAYTRIRLIERPLLFGPMPKTWPKAALHADPLPKSFPGIPFKGSNVLLTRWTTDQTPVGATQYWIDWYVPEDSHQLVPKLIKQLHGQNTWRVPSNVNGRSIRIEPVKNGSNFVWMNIESGGATFEELPGNGWTRITVSWTDPYTGIRSSRVTSVN